MQLPILVAAATEMEFAGLPGHLGKDVRFFATGAGAPCTTMRLTELLCRERFAMLVNIGITGSYSAEIALGSVFQVVNDTFADLGIESPERFSPLREFSFCPPEIAELNAETPNEDFATGLETITGFTYNTVHGSAEGIARLGITQGLESMEGAAVQMVCKRFGLPHLQIRAVSNYVEPRNPANWNIPLALANLESETFRIIQKLRGK